MHDQLIDAVKRGDAAKVAALLDADRSLLAAKSENISAVLLACYYGHPEMARLFVERGAELTFAEACAVGDGPRALKLLEANPDLVRSFSDDGFPGVGLAIFFRHPELARQLIERGADVNAAARKRAPGNTRSRSLPNVRITLGRRSALECPEMIRRG
jgi:ankyrin repeat protein